MLLASTNTPPPCRSAMQRASNRVGTLTVAATLEDMRQRREELKRVSQLRGLPASESVNIAMDVRYNSTTITGRGKMGQNASQAIAVAVEGHTSQKQIVSMCLANKLCHAGAWMRAKGFTVKCPGGHAGCTASHPAALPFSEYDMGKQMGEEMALQNIMIKFATTDGDGRSAEGVQAAMTQLDPLWQVIRQADTTHLGQGQFRQVLKADFSKGMFPGEGPERKKEQQKMLALDVKNRCHRIFQEIYAEHTGDMVKISKMMPTVIEVTLDCYAGDCSHCRRRSVVCSGGAKNWFASSIYLSACGISHLNVSEEDRAILRELLRLRLGAEALHLTKANTNTNKNEAVNRSISACLPKNINFSRNAKSRACAAISKLNQGAGNALIKSLEVVRSPISKGGYVAKAVRQMQREFDYQRAYPKGKSARKAKMLRKKNQMMEYFKLKEERRVSDYVRGQLDPRIKGPRRKRKQMASDHNYCAEPFCKKSDHTYCKQ